MKRELERTRLERDVLKRAIGLFAEGGTASHGRVARWTRRHDIRALAGRRFRPCATNSRHNPPVAPNPLKQEFVAAAPNRVRRADITCIATGEGWRPP